MKKIEANFQWIPEQQLQEKLQEYCEVERLHQEEAMQWRRDERLKMRQEMGLVGRLLGSKRYIAQNTTALILLALLVLCTIHYFCAEPHLGESADGLFLTLSPLITLSLGYLFGEREKVERS